MVCFWTFFLPFVHNWSVVYSKFSILIVEGDSHVSRVLRNHLEESFPLVRVEIAGSPKKANQICLKFPPTVIIWDGLEDANGTRQEYIDAIPNDQWSRLIPVSPDADVLAVAKEKGAMEPVPKIADKLNTWSENMAIAIRPLLQKKKK